MGKWVLVVVISVLLLGFVMARVNRRTCMLAFGEGYLAAGELTVDQIRERFVAYLSPMRPMDAAAFVRGVGSALERSTDWRDVKASFVNAYKSGAITREGTNIRRLGRDEAARLFEIRAEPEVLQALAQHPDLPPLQAVTQTASLAVNERL